MDIRTFDLNLLKVVSAIYRYGTISKAAEKLHVTQPAVSNSLSRLRELTNDPIFIRGNNEQVPTEFGKSLIELSQNVLTQVQSRLETRSTFEPTTSNRTFRIAIDDYLEAVLLPYFLEIISPYLDNISLRFSPIKTLELARTMEADGIDLSICGWIDKDHSYKRVLFEEILSDSVCIAIPASNPYAKKKTLSHEDFMKLKFVIMRPEFSDYQIPELLLRKMGIHRESTIQVARATSLAPVAAASGSAITAPKLLFYDNIKYHNMKIFNMPFEFPNIKIVMGYHVRDAKSPAIMWLREKFHEAATNMKTKSSKK